MSTYTAEFRMFFYHMPFGRKDIDDLDRLNFDLLQGFWE